MLTGLVTTPATDSLIQTVTGTMLVVSNHAVVIATHGYGFDVVEPVPRFTNVGEVISPTLSGCAPTHYFCVCAFVLWSQAADMVVTSCNLDE